jgi:hypothetical protein
MTDVDIAGSAVNADELQDAPFFAQGEDKTERTGISGRVFFDESSGKYWMQNAEGEWRGRPEKTFSAYLKFIGYCPVVRTNNEKEKISELDHVLANISLNHAVDWAGPLAGHRRGMVENNGYRILVTKSFKLPDTKAGTMEDFQTIMDLINQQLAPTALDGIDQVRYLLGWWKHSLECLVHGYRKNLGMALVLAGPRGCGKSLLKKLIVRSLGGRECQPYSYLAGRDNFNGEFLKSECWCVDDDQSQTDARFRDEVGSKIKKIVADEVFHVRGKHVESLDLKLYRRLIVCVNDEPEKLLVLPQLTDDIVDKMLILHCHAPEDEHDPMPMPVVTPQDQDRFMDQLEAELPYFMHYLVNEYEIDPELFGRFGIKHFQHPHVRRVLFELSSENVLLDQLNRVFFGDSLCSAWRYGTATDIREYLTSESAPLSVREKNAIRSVSWLGRQLSRIAEEHPDRFQLRRSSCGNHRYWCMCRPGQVVGDTPLEMMGRIERHTDSTAEMLSDDNL